MFHSQNFFKTLVGKKASYRIKEKNFYLLFCIYIQMR